MKYVGMPMGMWFLFHNSFKKDLVKILGYDEKCSDEITGRAKKKYKEIIGGLPEFEKEDRFTMNIVNCALLAAFYLQMDPKPDVDRIKIFYNDAMMTPAMQWFCKKSGKKKFSEVVPAMCALDYTMAQAGGASEFVREYTLASGDPYCDCGYKKKVQP